MNKNSTTLNENDMYCFNFIKVEIAEKFYKF